ncbi:hypothetical protein QVD99_002333 [Batrachochytrium dendrobatidis]|nr:hypothetical protein O5D80_004959 [Batrachochytrium dendrobatidis]KAK5671311.1 hypothetical protein QVD99_002333 [Batrachochytrium dendrobatidis]
MGFYAISVLVMMLVINSTAVRVPLYRSSRSASVFNPAKSANIPITSTQAACFMINLNVDDGTFNVMVDTGSSDTVIPVKNLNNYNGPTLDYMGQPNAKMISGSYASKAGWTGYGLSLFVGLSGTDTTADNAPIVNAIRQTANPIFIDGQDTQGLLGLAYSAAAVYKTNPSTVMDAWVAAGQFAKNEVAFRACPWEKESQSSIDFGNTQPVNNCGKNGSPNVWVKSPEQGLFSVDIKGISVHGTPVRLPSAFQRNGRLSIIDSCTTDLKLPGNVINAIRDIMIRLGGFPPLNTARTPAPPTRPINLALLPSITFHIATGGAMRSAPGSTISVTIGPQQYLIYRPGYWYQMAAFRSDDDSVILGGPFFTSLNIVHDRTNHQIGLSLGCGCDSAQEDFPKIVGTNGMQWSPKSPNGIFPPRR